MASCSKVRVLAWACFFVTVAGPGPALACAASSPARLAVLADRGFEGFGRDRQPAAAGDGAEHDRADDRAAFLRKLRHVEEQGFPGVGLDRLAQALRIGAAVAHRDLLVHREEAADRCDGESAVRGDEAAGDGAPGLQQFARDRDVDVADAGIERQHRLAAVQRGGGRRHDLDIIGGRAGALRDAGDRGALHREAALFRRLDDPVGQHAAAFAAERGDQQGDRAGVAHAATCSVDFPL